MRIFVMAIAAAAFAFAVPATAQNPASPHEMTDADGAPDMDKCGFCHNDDLTLARPRSETCTLCHGRSLHAGAQRHINAEPARVTRLTGKSNAEELGLPLTAEGGIFCGTCHVFHDPAVSGEEILDAPYDQPKTGLSGTVGADLSARVANLSGAHISAPGTRRMRLPVADGTLCTHCHGDKK